jgi:hypothetical protein
MDEDQYMEALLANIDKAHLQNLRYCYKATDAVPKPLLHLMSAIHILTQPPSINGAQEEITWRLLQAELKDAERFVRKLHTVVMKSHTCEMRPVKLYLQQHPDVKLSKLRRINPTAGFLCEWLMTAINNAERNQPDIVKLKEGEDRAIEKVVASAMIKRKATGILEECSELKQMCAGAAADTTSHPEQEQNCLKATTTFSEKLYHEFDRSRLQIADALAKVTRVDVIELCGRRKPSPAVELCVAAVFAVLNPELFLAHDRNPPWDILRRMLANVDNFLRRMREFDIRTVNKEHMSLLSPFLELDSFHPLVLRRASRLAAGLCAWVRALSRAHQADLFSAVIPQFVHPQDMEGKSDETKPSALVTRKRFMGPSYNELLLDRLQMVIELPVALLRRTFEFYKRTHGTISVEILENVFRDIIRSASQDGLNTTVGLQNYREFQTMSERLSQSNDELITQLKSRFATEVFRNNKIERAVPSEVSWEMIERSEAQRNEIASSLKAAEAELSVSREQLNPSELEELSTFVHPPPACALVIAAARIALTPATEEPPEDLSWDASREILKNGEPFVASIRAVDPLTIQPASVELLQSYTSNEYFTPEKIPSPAIAAANICRWVLALMQVAAVAQNLPSAAAAALTATPPRKPQRGRRGTVAPPSSPHNGCGTAKAQMATAAWKVLEQSEEGSSKKLMQAVQLLHEMESTRTVKQSNNSAKNRQLQQLAALVNEVDVEQLKCKIPSAATLFEWVQQSVVRSMPVRTPKPPPLSTGSQSARNRPSFSNVHSIVRPPKLSAPVTPVAQRSSELQRRPSNGSSAKVQACLGRMRESKTAVSFRSTKGHSVRLAKQSAPPKLACPQLPSPTKVLLETGWTAPPEHVTVTCASFGDEKENVSTQLEPCQSPIRTST